MHAQVTTRAMSVFLLIYKLDNAIRFVVTLPGKLPRQTLLVPCLGDSLGSIYAPTYQYSDTPSSLEVLSFDV